MRLWLFYRSPGQRPLIFQVDEGHHSQFTANKYRVDFRHFLDYIKIQDLEVLLDLGKDAIQELVIKYAKSLRDNPDKKYSRSTVNNRIAAILYFLDNNDIEEDATFLLMNLLRTIDLTPLKKYTESCQFAT